MRRWTERAVLLLIVLAWISLLSLYSSSRSTERFDQRCDESPAPSLSPSPLPSVSPSSGDPIRSSSQCFELPDMSGGCIIHNLYYSNEDVLYLVTDEAPEHTPIVAESASMGYEDMYRLPADYPIPRSRWVPYADNTISRESYLIHPAYLEAHFQVKAWPGTAYVVNPVYETVNPYYFPKDYNQLWEVLWYTQWHSRWLPLPAMDWLLPGHHNVPAGWQQGMMDFLLSYYPTSQTLFRGDLEEMGIGQSTLLRLERAVLLSDKPHYWSGHAPAAQFRAELQAFLSTPTPEKNVQLIIPVRTRSRALLNLRQVLTMASYYSIPTHVFSEDGDGAPLVQQAQEASAGHVRIVTHGAGEANNMFAVPASAVIEIFPYGMRNQIFEREAQFLGLHYQAVYSWIKPPMSNGKELYSPWYYQHCQNQSNYEHNLNACIRVVKNQHVWAPIREVEEALLTAFASQGVDLRLVRRRRFVDYLQRQATKSEDELDAFHENDPYRSDNFLV